MVPGAISVRTRLMGRGAHIIVSIIIRIIGCMARAWMGLANMSPSSGISLPSFASAPISASMWTGVSGRL